MVVRALDRQAKKDASQKVAFKLLKNRTESLNEAVIEYRAQMRSVGLANDENRPPWNLCKFEMF